MSATADGYEIDMSDHSDDHETDDVSEADRRNAEPDALEPDAGGHSGPPDDDPSQRMQPDTDLDVTDPTEDGDPIHHAGPDDIGSGGD